MIAGALLDAGAPAGALLEILKRLNLPHVEIDIRREVRGSFAGTRFDVRAPREHHHRHLSDILQILESARLPGRVFEKAASVFRRIARAEARAHGIPEEKVHFHEVGAADTIVDIVAGCACFELLNIQYAAASAVELGGGMVACDHGSIPVPAPGTAGALLGARVRLGGLVGERTTPTGAAMLATFVSTYGEPVEMVPEAVGYGAGARDTTDVANLLRVIVGEMELAGSTADRIAVLEANLDDTPGETLGYVIERALAAGALDAFVTPATMKKGRPGFVITVLVPVERRVAIEDLLFRETPTLGVRRTLADRTKLRREVRAFSTSAGEARAKLRWRSDGTVDVSAEFDDARAIAQKCNIPLGEAVAVIEGAARKALAERPPESQNVAAAQRPSHNHDHHHDHGHGHPHDHSHSHSQGHPHVHEHPHLHSGGDAHS